MSGAYGDRSLKETPTWAVALVSAVFVIISILIEHGIHSLGKWFQKHKKKAMTEALEKIKDGQNTIDFSIRGAPTAHFHLSTQSFPHPIQCNRNGSSTGQNEEVESMGARNYFTGI